MFTHCILANEHPSSSNLQFMLFLDGVQLWWSSNLKLTACTYVFPPDHNNAMIMIMIIMLLVGTKPNRNNFLDNRYFLGICINPVKNNEQ